jgi:hypothetical protein
MPLPLLNIQQEMYPIAIVRQSLATQVSLDKSLQHDVGLPQRNRSDLHLESDLQKID